MKLEWGTNRHSWFYELAVLYFCESFIHKVSNRKFFTLYLVKKALFRYDDI